MVLRVRTLGAVLVRSYWMIFQLDSGTLKPSRAPVKDAVTGLCSLLSNFENEII